MKLATLSALFLATAAFAIPAPADDNHPNRALADTNLFERDLVNLDARKACYHSSDCSWFYAAKCEDYCRKWGQDVGVDRMEKCNALNQKRCCCSKM